MKKGKLFAAPLCSFLSNVTYVVPDGSLVKACRQSHGFNSPRENSGEHACTSFVAHAGGFVSCEGKVALNIERGLMEKSVGNAAMQATNANNTVGRDISSALCRQR